MVSLASFETLKMVSLASFEKRPLENMTGVL